MIRKVPAKATIIAKASEPAHPILHDSAVKPINNAIATNMESIINKVLSFLGVSVSFLISLIFALHQSHQFHFSLNLHHQL